MKLLKKEKVSKDAWSFYFERPSGFNFIAGQYIKVKLNPDLIGAGIPNPDERGTSRFFSIASSPTENNLMITTRIIQSSFKKTLVVLKEGDEIEFRGPHGAFVLDEKARSIVFLTGGIGITPFRSMFVFAHDLKLPAKITLIASFSTVEDLIFYDYLSGISGGNLKFVATITGDPVSNWHGEAGRIDEKKIKKYVENLSDSIYYIAGPESLVFAMKDLVKRINVQEDNIKTEIFPGY